MLLCSHRLDLIEGLRGAAARTWVIAQVRNNVIGLNFSEALKHSEENEP